MTSSLLNHSLKTGLHVMEVMLIIAALSLSGARLTIKTPPATRANVLALSMGAKSLIVIAYQLLTEYMPYFYRWASTKANAILNALEVVFWAAVIVLVAMNLSAESGTAFIISVIVIVVAVVLVLLSAWTAAISFDIHRQAQAGHSGKIAHPDSPDARYVQGKYMASRKSVEQV